MHDRHDYRYECTLIIERLDAIGEHERTSCRRLDCRGCLRDLGVVPCIDLV